MGMFGRRSRFLRKDSAAPQHARGKDAPSENLHEESARSRGVFRALLKMLAAEADRPWDPTESSHQCQTTFVQTDALYSPRSGTTL